MNLLPKSSSEFSQREYWDKFFKSRGKHAFEWYGTYLQLCTILHKYMNHKDNILVAGCGNSTLSADLYNSGFRMITSVDISDIVIRQMREKYSESHPEMKFCVMDLLNMNFDEGCFSCVLDKGTLDALMSDADCQSEDRARLLFKEVNKVLKIGGRYICISLLQEHILHTLLSYFNDQGWMIRVVRCEEAEMADEENDVASGKPCMERFPFPVFVVVCTKFKKLPQMTPLVEYSPSLTSIERLNGIDSLKDRIQSVQQFTLLCHQLLKNKRSTSEDVAIELMDPGSSKTTAKYKLFVVDRDQNCRNKFAAFIVPQGRESEWLFSCNEGRRQLTENAQFQRLVIVHLGRDHHFESLEQVQNELAAVVSSLQPTDLPSNSKIPFLSLGSNVNQRREIYRGCSDLTGEFVVEEVDDDDHGSKGHVLRRLIFLSNPNVIQSEARLVKGKIDLKYLACQHHHTMVQVFRQHLKTNTNLNSILVVGLGGGALCTYLHKEFPKLQIDAVEIDPSMVVIASKYFGFNANPHLKAHVADGIQYIHDIVSSGTSYGCIMFDVDCKDRSLGMSCPPPGFVESSFIQTLSKGLNQNGLFILNLVCRDRARREEVLDNLRECFRIVKTAKIKDEVNEIISCYTCQ